MTADQMSIFDFIDCPWPLKATPALLDGRAELAQCNNCGTVACSPRKLREWGPCPGCGDRSWKKERPPVSVFAKPEDVK